MNLRAVLTFVRARFTGYCLSFYGFVELLQHGPVFTGPLDRVWLLCVGNFFVGDERLALYFLVSLNTYPEVKIAAAPRHP
jgi:hypothetical protein